MPLYVANKRMQQDEARALLHAAQDRVACRARHARPAVEPGDNQHLEGHGTGQVFFDVAVNSLEVVAVATVLVTVIVADTPAVSVPVAIYRDGGWFKL